MSFLPPPPSSSSGRSCGHPTLPGAHLCLGKLGIIDALILYGSYQLVSYASQSSLVKTLTQRVTSQLSNVGDAIVPLIYKGFVPDFIIRFGIRVRLYNHLLLLRGENAEDDMKTKMDIIAQLKTMPVAIETDAANEQHYEVPAAFYCLILGPMKKYSSGLWPTPHTTFEQSEVAMLDSYCERAQLADGMSIVDLGCGWGSLTLHMAAKYPRAKITSISNSHSQREYILREAKERGLNVDNIRIVTCNVSDDKGALDVVKNNDRVISIEMFEHMKNYDYLLRKIHGFLKPNGKLFVHIFSHRQFTYHFDKGWLSDNFFTGGTMPSDDLLLYFADHFSCAQHWRVNGTNYEKTSNAWLALLDKNWENGKLRPVLEDAYGKGREVEWYVNWRLFFMSCAELWGYDKGEEWIVSHYLFDRR